MAILKFILIFLEVLLLFILLIFFIATTTFRMASPVAVKLALPEAKTAEELGKQGHEVCDRTVASLLHGLGYSADCRIMPIESLAAWFSWPFGFSCRVGEAA